MPNRICLLIVFCINSICYAQNYIQFRNCLNEASYWFYEEKFDSALVYFEKAEEFDYLFYPKDAHLYSRVLWELGENKKSIRVLRKGGIDSWFKKDTTYYLGMDAIDRKKILKKIPSSEKMMPPNKSFFDTIVKNDQKYRQELKNLNITDSVQYEIVRAKMLKQDVLNREMLISYISEYGFPGGYFHTDPIITVLLLHATPDWYFENYGLLLNEIKAGRMNPRDFAFGFERAYNDKNCESNSIYYVYENPKISAKMNPELVFINRCLIGLDPYFDNPNNFLYKRGESPKKSIFYTYYSEKKEYFNCSRF